jgi:multidrug transporter EmrE-like cation transporter
MALLLLCVTVNAFIGVIFKMFDRYKVNVLPAVVVNYFVCVLTSMVLTQSFTVNTSTFSAPYFLPALVLGVLFVTIFVTVGHTYAKFGMVVTTIFHKLSLLAPTLVAVIFFGEHMGWMKAVGILLAISAILFITGIWEKVDSADLPKFSLQAWILPIITFLGSCFIDTGLFLVEALNIAESGDIDFVATLFFCAGCIGSLFIMYKLSTGGMEWNTKDIIAGIGLGIPNFFSIYLLLLLLSNGWDGSVIFPINNVGILAFSAFIGFLFFKEKITLMRIGGVVLSIIAILMIANG